MSQAEIILRVSALCLLCGYLLLRHVRRDWSNRNKPVKWNGEVFDAKPLCSRMAQFRKTRRMTSPAEAKEAIRQRTVLKLFRNAISRFGYFRHLRENASRSDF